MTTTANSGLGERNDGASPNNALRWTYSVIAILFAGVAGYVLAYTIGIAVGGSATMSSTVLQLLGGLIAGALCVVFMKVASKHAPTRSEVDPG